MMNELEKKLDRLAKSRLPRKKRFWLGMLIYLGILAVLTIGIVVALWMFLEQSQAEIDRLAEERAAQQAYETAVHRAPQLAFEDWQRGLTTDYWTDLWYEQASTDLDIREQVYDYMAERFAPDAIEIFKAAEFTEAVPVYVLKNGDSALARVALSGSALDWSVSQVELLIEGTHSASVTVADRYHVFCNGRELGGEYAEEAASRLNYDLLEGELEGSVSWLSYNVEGLLLEPELTVEPPEGYGAFQTEEGDYLLLLEGDTSAFTSKAVKFVRAYLYYYMNGRQDTQENLDKVLGLLVPGTQAYRDMENTYVGVVWNSVYSGIDTSDTTAGDVFVWADNCCSVDVTYHARYGRQSDYSNGTMRLYFLRIDGTFVITNFVIL